MKKRSHFLPFLFVVLLVSLSSAVGQKTPVTLGDAMMNPDIAGLRGTSSYNWMKDGLSYTITKRDSGAFTQSIWKVDAKTGAERKLVDLSTLKMPGKDSPFRFRNYVFSEDERVIIFTISSKRIWRRSTVGEYAVYDTRNGRLIPLPKRGEGLRNVKVSPDSKWVGYVGGDDLYIMNLETGEETRLTHDGGESVYNGRFGWVYEEEFGITDGWQWSPDSKRIAYWHEDERGVPLYTLTDWSPLHPELIPLRYPKPGDPNPVERIGVIDIATKSTVWMDTGSDTDIYIPRIFWTRDPYTLCIMRLNRLQNHLHLLLGDVRTGRTRVLLEEKSSTGWVEVEHGAYLYFLKNGKQFLWASERSGWNHLYLYDMTGKLLNPVTSGPWEVTEVAGVSVDERTVYYVSTEQSPLERHLYAVRLDGAKKRRLSAEVGSHSFNMSPTCAVFSDTWSSVQQPPKSVFRNSDGVELRVIEEKKPDSYERYAWSPVELFTFRTSDGLELYGSLVKPPDFDPSNKYPLYFDVYGGPGTQAVRNEWPSAMDEYIANQGFILVHIDNRGGSGRGTDFKHRVYKQLGKWEANDYIECARFLCSRPYVDANNIVIWGWSYGGYMAALTLLLGADTFTAGVAVAPGTDWKLYDTIYAERYMQRPSDNPEGYKVGSCLEHADKLRGKLYIIHGGMDDNVHLQNTMQFIDKLNAAGKDYKLRIYPRGNHGVADRGTILSLYESFMTFFKQNLN
ncbi:MAG: S9 family peptidase [Bacteroidota bacterium]|nr:S9 family peptidase [Bacteroidota bacterium]